jgi:hypothetical protein
MVYSDYMPFAIFNHLKNLLVEYLASLQIGHVSLVRNALSSALDNLAREKECRVVAISLDAKGLSSPRSRRRRGWEALGLNAETIEFVRRLDGGSKNGGQRLAEPVRT